MSVSKASPHHCGVHVPAVLLHPLQDAVVEVVVGEVGGGIATGEVVPGSEGVIASHCLYHICTGR